MRRHLEKGDRVLHTNTARLELQEGRYLHLGAPTHEVIWVGPPRRKRGVSFVRIGLRNLTTGKVHWDFADHWLVPDDDEPPGMTGNTDPDIKVHDPMNRYNSGARP